MQSPQLQLYNRIFEKVQELGVSVIDVKDQFQSLPYPFVAVSDVQEKKQIFTNDSFNGHLTAKVDIWSRSEDKGAHYDLLSQCDAILTFMDDIEGYQVNFSDLLTNTMVDNDTDGDLIHSSLVVEYTLY
ncbi:hypothetical protein [Staphylococcus chromogenes]|uniref:hypothetical protein n=1 Tax=Staphylococcus chromogenes TaxID=46126 RepID=UPI003D7B2D2A